MFAEHTLGLADYIIRKATNMRVGFLDGKIKSEITLLRLCSHPPDKMVKFCIKQVGKSGMHAMCMSKTLQKYWINDKNTQIKRRTVLEVDKKLLSTAENVENLEKDFSELSEAQRSTILTVLSDVPSLNGVYFEHVWYVEEHNVLYNGHIIVVKPLMKFKIPKVIVTYWKTDEA